jgi:hypothetical protein
MWSIVSSNWWQSLRMLSVSVFSIFVAKYFVYNAWSCAGIIIITIININITITVVIAVTEDNLKCPISVIECIGV